MVLSEAEAEARLAALHRERAALDRAIADLTLYLELGRRLTAAPAPEDAVRGSPPGPASGALCTSAAAPVRPVVPPVSPHSMSPHSMSPHSMSPPAAPVPASVAVPAEAPSPAGHPAAAPGGLTEGALARRNGRALIDAALAVLDEAGHPLHASEILAVLAGRGLAVPGHDPVAALNTRLWKRSGPGGPLRRLGDAVYARAQEPTDERVDDGARA